MFYKVFIDDSGAKEYHHPYSRDLVDNPPVFVDYPDFWRKNYFVLCGIRVKGSDIGEINDKINRLKEEFFGTKTVEIKSDWLRNHHQRKKRYLSRYNLTDERLNEFGEAFVDLISANQKRLKIIAVVFDKRFYGETKRQTSEGTPLLKTAQVMFEKLEYSGGYNIVVFDQMEESLKLDRGSHKNIINVFVKNHGMENIYVRDYTKITDIKFQKSHMENFLQVADVCAYNVYRQFVEHGREWDGSRKGEDGKMLMATYSYFDRIKNNFAFNPLNRCVRGVGLVCLPDVGKINWGILEEPPNHK